MNKQIQLIVSLENSSFNSFDSTKIVHYGPTFQLFAHTLYHDRPFHENWICYSDLFSCVLCV